MAEKSYNLLQSIKNLNSLPSNIQASINQFLQRYDNVLTQSVNFLSNYIHLQSQFTSINQQNIQSFLQLQHFYNQQLQELYNINLRNYPPNGMFPFLNRPMHGNNNNKNIYIS